MRRFPLIVLLLAAACTSGETGGTVAPTSPAESPVTEARVQAGATTLPPPTLPEPPPPQSGFAGPIRTTHHGLDGNRYARGVGAMPQSEPVDVPLLGLPVWVVGAEVDGMPHWYAALEGGDVVRVVGGTVEPLDVELPPGAPFALVGAEVVAAAGDESPLTFPLVWPGIEPRRAAVTTDGGLRYAGVDLAAEPLPDARLVADPGGQVVLLSGPTDDYRHGVLGDQLEASTLTFLDSPPDSPPRVVELPAGSVGEGLAPILADLGGDGGREVVVTLSNPAGGARIAVYDTAGNILAEGPPIGLGRRWRHQIAVAPFGPAGELELVAVRTPHIGGVAEFYVVNGGRLQIVAEAPGVTSHVLGSRNLDLALAADADGDGRVELVAPTPDHTSLAGVRHESDGARIVWTAPLGGRLATNLAAVELPGGTLAFAAGTGTGTLRVWPAPTLDTSPDASAARMLADVEALLRRGPRVAGTPAELAALDHLLATLRGWYADVRTDTVELPQRGLTHNAWVTVGRGPTRVLLGAHYDSKEGSPGADDNASGVAVVLELARRLALDPPEELTVDLVFFGGEEIPVGFPADQHHFGSRHRAAELEAAGALPDYMVSVDQVGFDPNLLAVTFEDTDPAAAQALAEAAAALDVEVAIVSRGDISDHEAFARRGVPSVFMWRPENPAYHTPDDVTVRPDVVLEDVAILSQLLEDLAAG